uniref:Exostosin GT47 domain-containing protein n=1 Tax=Calcidiscus leptoporus TaxID=127549 RepID=A0A7S0J291_9EUKA|mmetsp:Transcript_3496/g.7886  ORF Transcript_3496/g.7886 Transcript_3496/m.7886 type:complete len:253 (+) Transcript_3496:618-1376(+)
MKSARYCYVPKGWDMGDSDRYLPALLYGCVPVMADPLEAMPLVEHPEMDWEHAALYVQRSALKGVVGALSALPPSTDRRLVAKGATMWPRLLHTTLHFSSSSWENKECKRQARARGINVSATTLCSSYLGEDGSTDTYHTLMEILKRRVYAPRRPLIEPWACLPSNRSSRPRLQADTRCQDDRGKESALPKAWEGSAGAALQGTSFAWYRARAKYYERKLSQQQMPFRPVQALPPARAHRRMVAVGAALDLE